MDPYANVETSVLMEAYNLVTEDDYDEMIGTTMTKFANDLCDMTSNANGKWGGSRPGRRKSKNSNYAEAYEALLDDYFRKPNEIRSDGSGFMGPRFTDEDFERRFRMPRDVFDQLYKKSVRLSSFLEAGQRCDASGKKGIPPVLKITAALRMLCYGVPADFPEESMQMSESTILEAEKSFCWAVVEGSGETYLRTPTGSDIIKIEQLFAEIGFPGCIGCLDCSGLEWGPCPKAEQGITVGKEKAPSLRMEVVCDLNLRVWSLFAGLPGMLNDLNIIEMSPFFSRVTNDSYPPVLPTYSICGETFNYTYFLLDGIYQNFKFLVSSLSNPSNDEERAFCARQGARKCVERLFAVLKSRFAIFDRPSRFWYKEEMNTIVKACVIVHNMIVEVRKDDYLFNGVYGLRRLGERGTIETSWQCRELANTSSSSVIRNMRSIDDQPRLKKALGRHIFSLIEDGSW